MEIVYSFSKDLNGKITGKCEAMPHLSATSGNPQSLVSSLINNLCEEYNNNLEINEIEVIDNDNELYQVIVNFDNLNLIN